MDAAARSQALERGVAGGWRPCFVSRLKNFKMGKSTTMKKFICPIDDRIEISLPDELPMTQVIYSNGLRVNISITNCETPLPNADFKMISMGCIGCHPNKEQILKYVSRTLDNI